MQLTRFADYSLRVLMVLAHQDGASTTIREVAEAQGISENHLMKVVHTLGKRGYVKTTRGKGGGISLARDAADINVGTVIRDVEPLTPVECFQHDYDGRCLLFKNCRLRGVLYQAQAMYLKTLDGCSIADLVAPTKRLPAPATNPPPARKRRTSPARA